MQVFPARGLLSWTSRLRKWQQTKPQQYWSNYITSRQTTQNHRELRRLLRRVGYYRKYIPGFAKVANSLTDLLWTNFSEKPYCNQGKWASNNARGVQLPSNTQIQSKQVHQAPRESLIRALTSPPILAAISWFHANGFGRTVLYLGKYFSRSTSEFYFRTVFSRVYINDLTADLKRHVKLFADNTSFFTVVQEPNTAAEDMNHDLELISKWAHNWAISFNPDPQNKPLNYCFLRKDINWITLLYSLTIYRWIK